MPLPDRGIAFYGSRFIHESLGFDFFLLTMCKNLVDTSWNKGYKTVLASRVRDPLADWEGGSAALEITLWRLKKGRQRRNDL